jgi:pimeloyl-ACP methyl ester carboxylesterase
MTTEQRLANSLGVDFAIKQIPIGNYQINYLVAGKGDPLLLIHGANFGWGVWYPNIPELSKHFTVYAIDLPGAGRSSRINYAKLDLQRDLVDVVEQFISANQLENAHLVGFSVGGWLTMKIALLHAERKNKLIIENSVGFTDYMGRSDKIIGIYPFAKLIAKTILIPKRKNKNIEKFLRGIFYNHDLVLKSEFIEYFYETMKSSHNLLFISRLTALTRQFSLTNELTRVKNEILIVWGTKDKIIPLHKNRAYFTLLSNSRIKIMKEAGHIPSLEKPQEFNKALLEFLRR